MSLDWKNADNYISNCQHEVYAIFPIHPHQRIGCAYIYPTTGYSVIFGDGIWRMVNKDGWCATDTHRSLILKDKKPIKMSDSHECSISGAFILIAEEDDEIFVWKVNRRVSQGYKLVSSYCGELKHYAAMILEE